MTVPCTGTIAGTIGVDDKVALCIIASRGTHHIHETLSVFVNGVIGVCCVCGIISTRTGECGEAP